MKDNDLVTINLRCKSKDGKEKTEPITISKEVKEIIEAEGLYYEDVILHYLYTTYPEALTMHIEKANKLNKLETRLLKYVIKEVTNNIDTLHYFDVHALAEGTNICVNKYLETLDPDSLDAAYIIDYYNNNNQYLKE